MLNKFAKKRKRKKNLNFENKVEIITKKGKKSCVNFFNRNTKRVTVCVKSKFLGTFSAFIL